MKTEDGKEFLTVREVARRCHRSEETVRRWIWSGKLRAQKLGNQLFVEERDVSEALHPATDGGLIVLQPARKLTDAEFRKLEAEEKRFRDVLFRRHGNFDSAELVSQSHEDH